MQGLDMDEVIASELTEKMANLSASMKIDEVSVSIRSSWIAQASRTVILAKDSLVGK